MRKVLASLICCFVLIFHFNLQVASAEGLDVGVRILPGKENVSSNRFLWMAINQGNTQYRDFIVSGSKKYDLRVIPTIHQMIFVNDKPAYSQELSPINAWTTFEEQYQNGFIVRAKKQKRFTLAITPPFDMKDEAFDAYLVVRVEAVDNNGKAILNETGASIPLEAQLATPMWLGVGNPKKYRLKFAINDVAGVKYGGKKYIRVYSENKGLSPIAPKGSIQLKSLDFEMPTKGPFPFFTFGVKAKTKFKFDVPIAKSIKPGNWMSYIELVQGNYIVTKSISKKIKFRTVEKLNEIENRADDYQFQIGDYTNLILPSLGIGLIVLAYWRTVNSNRKLKRELATIKSSPPDDSV